MYHSFFRSFFYYNRNEINLQWRLPHDDIARAVAFTNGEAKNENCKKKGDNETVSLSDAPHLAIPLTIVDAISRRSNNSNIVDNNNGTIVWNGKKGDYITFIIILIITKIDPFASVYYTSPVDAFKLLTQKTISVPDHVKGELYYLFSSFQRKCLLISGFHIKWW